MDTTTLDAQLAAIEDSFWESVPRSGLADLLFVTPAQEKELIRTASHLPPLERIRRMYNLGMRGGELRDFAMRLPTGPHRNPDYAIVTELRHG